ncbi:GNAT family N-acetyltransferase [Synechococcus elongatus]|uniref:GNAT family N-acetyltransferase n=1 Tax=Synechococcus elongatus TaxID=32046 RepID=UPI000F7E651F|nr:GNAT family N-acetyltransferase [Synechococcus elongatus]
MVSSLQIRAAQPADLPEILTLIRELASFEELEHQVIEDPDLLNEHLFGPQPYASVQLAEWDGAIAGYVLYFMTYSSFRKQPSLYLEDLFVRPSFRRQGIATALLQQLAAIATERQCGRVEWAVLDWNQRAIDFYEGLGAKLLPDWRICRLEGAAIGNFAGR